MFREFDFENRPIVEIVDEILADANKLGASDIHFDPTPDSLSIRVRIDGELREYTRVPEAVKKNLLTRVKIISGMNITETRLPQDGAIKGSIDTYAVDMRVSSLPIVDGEKIVIRLLDYSKSMEGLESLQFSPTNLDKILKAIASPNGIILVTGATGSGKSTTVYSILQRLNDVRTNIITVEDPVEMKIPGINQVQVMSEIGLTFGAALRSILRQDPDTIMIGEIRDDETARIAVRASITGHLVLSTIHTNNALTTIERLLDMEVERYLLGSALNTIVAQRLAKRLCPKCKVQVATTPYEKKIFEKVLHRNVDYIYEPKGCEECFEGYKGRIAVHEVLSLDQEIRDAIVGNTSKQELRNLVYKDGKTIMMFADGLEKVVSGDTSFQEIINLIDITEDIDEKDEELKKAILGTESDLKVQEQAVAAAPTPVAPAMQPAPVDNQVVYAEGQPSVTPQAPVEAQPIINPAPEAVAAAPVVNQEVPVQVEAQPIINQEVPAEAAQPIINQSEVVAPPAVNPPAQVATPPVNPPLDSGIVNIPVAVPNPEVPVTPTTDNQVVNIPVSVPNQEEVPTVAEPVEEKPKVNQGIDTL